MSKAVKWKVSTWNWLLNIVKDFMGYKKNVNCKTLINKVLTKNVGTLNNKQEEGIHQAFLSIKNNTKDVGSDLCSTITVGF